MGTFDVKCDGKSVLISSRAAQSLFAHLILTAGTAHRREKLAGMLWPETPEEKARAYLRHELWRIRKAFSPEPRVDYLLSDDITISFNPSAEYWLDAAALRNLNESAPTEELMNALSFFKGELLPGFYEEWVTEQREHLQVLYEKKIARLLKLLAEEERWHEVLEWAERWIAQGQEPESAFRYLLTAYNALGDHAKVAAAYQRCVRALREIGLEPSEETRALAFQRTSRLHIPVPLTSFIGREKELKEVASLFSKSRLVTLTGSGGVGKTRLAIQVVPEVLDLFPDGVWFLDLAPLTEAALVPGALASLFGLHESAAMRAADLLVNYLRFRTALIIFDNCEHLIESAAQLVYSLLTSCQNLSILATSRESLRVAGEIPYRVPSLETPRSDAQVTAEELSKIESVRLFVERASFSSLGFAIHSQNAHGIVQICQRLDGIPLAIELAAARVSVLSVEQILKRLDDRFNLLTHGLRSSLPRQQTLRALIEWSYDLLSEKEQLLFTRLAVFVGGWTLEAAEEVCSGGGIEPSEVLDLLSELVDKSLVLAEPSNQGEIRYRRLETIRQFACEKLTMSGESEDMPARHFGYFLNLSLRAEQARSKVTQWIPKFEDELGNLRAALEWSLQNQVTLGQQLAAASSWFWGRGGHLKEGYSWLQRVLIFPTEDDSLTKAKLLAAAGWLASDLSYDEQAKSFAEESLAIFRRLEDKTSSANMLSLLGGLAFYRSEFEQAVAYFEESCALYRELGEKSGLGNVLTGLGYTAEAQGNFEQARRYYEESLLIAKELGNQGGIGWVLYMMGNLAVSEQEDVRAMELYEEALEIMKISGPRHHVCWIMNSMGALSLCNGNIERGRIILKQTADLCQKMGDQVGVASCLQWLGWSALRQAKYNKARSYYAEALSLLQGAENNVEIAPCLIGVGQLLALQGDAESFALLMGAVEKAVPDLERRLKPYFRRETQRFIENVRLKIGVDAYTVAWEAGRHVKLQDAIASVLKKLQ